MNTHNLIVDFGRHKGERWTRLPIPYLKWLANMPESEKTKIAKVELDRRNVTTLDQMEISGHAVDRASQQLLSMWKETESGKQGLHSWLYIMATNALREGEKEGDNRIYNGIKFAFEFGELFPTLKTVIKL